jgi:hypothetical protein
MAKFTKIKINPEDPGDDVWKKILAQMTVAQSVELVAVASAAGKVSVEVRAWDDIRKDKSNADDASSDKNY